jgi:hypothetical protein
MGGAAPSAGAPDLPASARLAIDPASVALWWALGDAALLVDRTAKANPAFGRALVLDPQAIDCGVSGDRFVVISWSFRGQRTALGRPPLTTRESRALDQLQIDRASREVLRLLDDGVLVFGPANDVGVARRNVVRLEPEAEIENCSGLEDSPCVQPSLLTHLAPADREHGRVGQSADPAPGAVRAIE